MAVGLGTVPGRKYPVGRLSPGNEKAEFIVTCFESRPAPQSEQTGTLESRNSHFRDSGNILFLIPLDQARLQMEGLSQDAALASR